MNKRDLQRLEGLLLLALLYKIKNKRLCASIVGISVDTLTKYINFLENDIGTKLQVSCKSSYLFTSKGTELISKLKTLDIENWQVQNKKINLFDLKNIRGVFYLKAISLFGNKRNASQRLATSIETINLYTKYLQHSLQLPLLKCDNQGTYLTNEGTVIILKFDRITKFINHLIEQKYNTNKYIRVAFEKDIVIPASSFTIIADQDITVFSNNPNLHVNEWDIAISFSEPNSDNLIVYYTRKVKCGFFASIEYLSKFGMPQNIEDIKQNHLVIDGRNQPYADKNYCDFIDECQNTKFIENLDIAIPDTVSYGCGICLVPLTIPRNNLVYLDHISSNAEATLHLSIHKSFNCIPKYRQAMNTYRDVLNLI